MVDHVCIHCKNGGIQDGQKEIILHLASDMELAAIGTDNFKSWLHRFMEDRILPLDITLSSCLQAF